MPVGGQIQSIAGGKIDSPYSRRHSCQVTWQKLQGPNSIPGNEEMAAVSESATGGYKG